MQILLKTGLLIIGFSIMGCAQKGNVSKNAEQAFNQRFPNADKVSWEKENAGEWEVEFELEGKEFSANFNVNGDWLETESEIENSKVPAKVSKLMIEKYSEAKIKEIYKVERKDGVFYEYEFKLNGETQEVLLDSSANLVKKQNSEED